MTKLYIPKDAAHSGIEIEFVKSSKIIRISGWYDSHVGISGMSSTLESFFKDLGITRKICMDVFDKAEGEK